MTGKKNEARDALDRLADALVDDVLSMSDQDLLVEYRETGRDPDNLASEMRALVEHSVLVSNKSKLAAAKAGVARARAAVQTIAPIDIVAARKQLRALLQTTSIEKLTMAARKESDLSDSDVISLLEDLRALGVQMDNDSGNGSA